jgi:hypothetical protein
MWFVFQLHHYPGFIHPFFSAVEYHGLSADVEREIFQRVQLGVSLTAAGAEPA